MSESIESTYRLQQYDYDVIVVGTGAAGLFAALSADRGLRVLLLSKSELTECNSQLAQGGIAVALDDSDHEAHVQDTLRVGCYWNDPEAVEALVHDGKAVIKSLESFGMQFDRDEAGRLHKTKEGGHSINRIVHHLDATGAELMRTLIEEAQKRDNLTLLTQCIALDLILEKGRCVGLWCSTKGVGLRAYTAPQVVLATGGIGELYTNSTNSKIATGDGLAIALRAGAALADMEFVQFHPTAFYDAHSDRRFLISEAVRGEGAYLRNEKGERFMVAFKPFMELSGRDVVAREIYLQILNSQKPCVYIDLRHLDPEFSVKRFPTIFKKCLDAGLDFRKDLIPVSPVQHYMMGGIRTDAMGRTNVEGLYACGEVSSTGIHGANRLASNSLLEALVYGARVGCSMKAAEAFAALMGDTVTYTCQPVTCPEAKGAIKRILSQCAFIYRREEWLREGKVEIEAWVTRLATMESCDLETREAYNMALVGRAIIDAALLREHSLGAHQRLEDGETP